LLPDTGTPSLLTRNIRNTTTAARLRQDSSAMELKKFGRKQESTNFMEMDPNWVMIFRPQKPYNIFVIFELVNQPKKYIQN
jgi:hypothetical protein